MKIDISTDSLALLSPKTEQYEMFLCNGSVRDKTEWDTEVNFDFVFLFSIDIHWISITMRAFWSMLFLKIKLRYLEFS